MTERRGYSPTIIPVDGTKLHGSEGVWRPEMIRLAYLIVPQIVALQGAGTALSDQQVATVTGFPNISQIHELRSAQAQGASEIIEQLAGCSISATRILSKGSSINNFMLLDGYGPLCRRNANQLINGCDLSPKYKLI